MEELIPKFLSVENTDGSEPVPDGIRLNLTFLISGALIWDHQNVTQNVVPGSTVHFHIVNIGAFGYFHVWIEEHNMTVIEVDGVDVEPYVTPGIDVAVGQRVSVLVTMKNDTSTNYPIVGAMGDSVNFQSLE
jgi:iron transport multicopper oxidase